MTRIVMLIWMYCSIIAFHQCSCNSSDNLIEDYYIYEDYDSEENISGEQLLVSRESETTEKRKIDKRGASDMHRISRGRAFSM